MPFHERVYGQCQHSFAFLPRALKAIRGHPLSPWRPRNLPPSPWRPSVTASSSAAAVRSFPS